MFIDFFYLLKKRKVPVSITEWMTLMDALSQGYISNLDEFYYLGRAILVKSEAHFDYYDVAFKEYFQGIEAPPEITEQVLEWLKSSFNRTVISEEERAMLQRMDLQELIKELEKRLKEQKEQHDGGGHWVGRGGTSPFGHSGHHPAGIRIGGQGGGMSAVQVAEQRRFRNYRSDVTLDVRQIKVALRGLRQLTRIGPEDELDVKKTIDATAKNAGDLEFIWGRSRRNAVKLLLIMDVGGSMIPYVELCSRLFSAAHQASHFKEFKFFYFHNCIYDNLYTDVERNELFPTEQLLRNFEPDYKLVLVGDGRMATSELLERNGAIYYYEMNETPGASWLKRLSEHFTHSVWLNPTEPELWNHPTVIFISRLFHMYSLTVEGLNESMKKLIVKK